MRETTFVRVDDMLIPQPAPPSVAVAGPASVTAPSFTPWPGGLVPIEFASGISDTNRAALFAACASWSKRAAVSCVPRASHSPFLRVTSENNGGCYATLGSYAGREPARMNLDANCWGQKSIIHELGHVFGLQHEHQRPDRDSYISIDVSAVDPEYLGAFTPITGAPTRGAYDFLSVMHYHDFAFAARPLTRTMLPKAGFEWYTYSLGSSDFPSTGDGDAVQAIYGGGTTYWPARVQNLHIAPGGGVRLAWDPPLGAPEVSQYTVTIYRGERYLESGIAQTLPLAPTATGVTLTLQAGHYFAIVKGDSADGEFARSTVFAFTVNGANSATGDLPPGVPTLAALPAGDDRVTLKWDRGVGAVPTLYTIYAGTTPGGSNLGSFPMGTATSVTTTAPAGVTAYIRVVASNEVGGATSNEVAFYVPGTPTSTIPSLTVDGDENPVSLAWSSPAGADVTQYTLVAGTAPGGTDLGTFPMGQARSLVANAPVGIPLYVRVLATTHTGTVASNEVRFQLPSSWVATAPTLAPAVVGGTTVTLAWSASNASAYTILARLTADGPVVASVPVGRAQGISIPNVPAGTYLVSIAATPGFAESNTIVVVAR